MSVCKACGSTKLTEHPCPECGWPILPPAGTPPAPVDVPARLREKAARLRTAKPKMVNGRVRMQVKITDAIEADLLDLLADSYEALTDKEPFWNPTCTLDPCEDCAPYRALLSRIEEASR